MHVFGTVHSQISSMPRQCKHPICFTNYTRELALGYFVPFPPPMVVLTAPATSPSGPFFNLVIFSTVTKLVKVCTKQGCIIMVTLVTCCQPHHKFGSHIWLGQRPSQPAKHDFDLGFSKESLQSITVWYNCFRT